MTDTVVAAIITGSAALSAAVISLVVQSRKSKHQSQPVPQTVIVTAPSIPSASQGTPQPVSRRTTDLSHKQISDAIEAVPPFQRDSIRDSFRGVYVTWRGTLFGASRRDDRGSVSLDDICIDGGLAHCYAPIQECDGLLIAPEGAEVIVTGKIDRISKHDVQLEDCTFKVLHKSVA